MGERIFALVGLTLPLVACTTPAPYVVTQHGLIGAPRPATYDGQPLPTHGRFEGYASTTRVTGLGKLSDSGAAVAQHRAGGAVRHAIAEGADIGAEVDGSWSA